MKKPLKKKGQPFVEWLQNSPMDAEDITTARVFLMIGWGLGIAAGVFSSIFFALLTR